MFDKTLMQKAATVLIHHIKQNNHMLVIIDSDVDGFTSSAILINYLYNLFPAWTKNRVSYVVHAGKQHGLNDHI